jgi:Trk K+ transport system NAD-binding subunit
MKSITALISAHLARGQHRGNLRVMFGLLGVLAVMVTLFSVLFHLLMAREGQEHSWLTGLYWTIVAMSTLGFGDITFTSDLGRMFSVVVVVTGTVFMLIILPFTFIQFFYAPWLEARDAARAPRELPEATTGHVLLTGFGPVDRALAQRLRQFRTPYVVLVGDIKEALDLDAQGQPVMVGDLDDPDTYARARVERAALVAATQSDPLNTNIAATVRERSATVPIVALASSPASVDILGLAGCHQVVQLGELLGRSMARRVFGRDGRSHVIGQLDHLSVAEAAAAGTPLIGRALRDSGLRARFNLNVAGVWERGHFTLGRPDTVVTPNTVLLLAGTPEQLAAYDAEFGLPGAETTSAVIIGGGRVGRATARSLAERGVDYRIVERVQGRSLDPSKTVLGDAADLEVLTEAGIKQADAVIVTSHDDAVNIYLTLYCRRLRPDMLILSRSTLERNALTLHRAGADFVLSYASMGASVVLNMLRRGRMLFVAEGLDVFTAPIPRALVGRTLAESHLRQDTGCSVLAVRTTERTTTTGPLDVSRPLPDRGELILIGDREAEDRFFAHYT